MPRCSAGRRRSAPPAGGPDCSTRDAGLRCAPAGAAAAVTPAGPAGAAGAGTAQPVGAGNPGGVVRTGQQVQPGNRGPSGGQPAGHPGPGLCGGSPGRSGSGGGD